MLRRPLNSAPLPMLNCKLTLANRSSLEVCRCQTLQRAADGRRSRLIVQCNELNKWGDTSGPDEGAGLDDDVFERATDKVLMKVLTARAVQKVLEQLNELDSFQANWLHNYCAANPPLQGDEFLFKLMRERPVAKQDQITKKTHFISPAQLAQRVILSRQDMAKMASKTLPAVVERDNISLLRQHLESSSYTSGSYDERAVARRKAASPSSVSKSNKKRD